MSDATARQGAIANVRATFKAASEDLKAANARRVDVGGIAPFAEAIEAADRLADAAAAWVAIEKGGL